MRTFRDLIIIFVLFGGIWFIASKLTTTTEKIITISIEKENKLTEFINKQIITKFDTIAAPYADSCITDIKNRLTESIGKQQCEIKISILKSPDINAFASFGGHVYVFTGLVDFTNNPEELAAILAHEIAHIEKKHVVENLIKQLGIRSIFLIITGGDPVLLQELLRITISSSMSKEMEREADEMAVEIMKNSNINPNHLVSFFIRLKEKDVLPESLKWITSHPMLDERIENILIKTEKLKINEIKFDFDWNKLKNELRLGS